jgi:hypothetical protein
MKMTSGHQDIKTAKTGADNFDFRSCYADIIVGYIFPPSPDQADQHRGLAGVGELSPQVIPPLKRGVTRNAHRVCVVPVFVFLIFTYYRVLHVCDETTFAAPRLHYATLR